MADKMQDIHDQDLGTSPSRINDPRIRHEVSRAIVWVAVIGAVALAVWIARPLLVIFGAMVFASMIDGGARLLGRALSIARAWRVAIVLFATVADTEEEIAIFKSETRSEVNTAF